MEKSLKWTILFLLIVVLTQSDLFIGFETSCSFLGFPNWLWYMIVVHLLFVVSLYLFSRSYYKNDNL